MVRYPPWHLVSHRHICAIPPFATYRAIIVRYPTKTSTKEFCDTIARSIARYEKYRCWFSKHTNSFLSVRIVKFFSLTEAPLPDPTLTPPNTPKRTRNGPETEPKRSRNGPKEPTRTRNGPEIKLSGVGRPGGLSGWGGGVGL